MTYAAFKKRIIIVADHDHSVQPFSVTDALKAQGFTDVRQVSSGEQIFDILRPLHDDPEGIALIIVNENLPHWQIDDMNLSLSSGLNGALIPFLVLSPHPTIQVPHSTDTPLRHTLFMPFNAQELLTAMHFLMRLKDERLLRLKQSERLVNELANKNVLDAKLKFLVAHDELTGLFNRSSLEYQLRALLNEPRQAQRQGVLLFIDIDRFSQINELEGFDVGDSLLVELTILIRKLMPSQSVFARIGADEFCLFLPLQTIESAQMLANTIKATVDNFRFFTGEVSYSVTVSIGVAAIDDASPIHHPGQLILHARQACNLAKVCGRDKIRLYCGEDHAIKERRRDIYWVPIIRKSIRDNDLFLVFQPVVRLEDGDVSH